MIVLLSPAKDLFLEPAFIKGTTTPALLEDAVPVAEKMKMMSPKKLASLMDLSPKLASLNFDRYKQWEAEPEHNVQL
nr:peroxide stress protein YaaA [Bacteroidota bacterium]